MSLFLCEFHLHRSWKRLLAQLGWREPRQDYLEDGWSRVHLVQQPATRPRVGFDLCGQADNAPADRVCVSPSGIELELHPQSASPAAQPPRFCLNHVAIDVADINSEEPWWEALLGTTAVMAREHVWEPVLQRHVQDCHLFREPHYYITLRSAAQTRINHVGWMTQDVQAVHEAAEMVRALDWTIVLAPREIDGSFLFHFQAADGLIHDFFCPLDALRRQAAGL